MKKYQNLVKSGHLTPAQSAALSGTVHLSERDHRIARIILGILAAVAIAVASYTAGRADQMRADTDEMEIRAK